MNLRTFIFVFSALVLLATLASGQTTPYNKLDKLKVNDLIAGKLEVQSTTKGAIPCPSMTQTQRNAIVSPLEGSCVFNQDSNTLNVYDGAAWVEVGAGGAGGGINNWETAHFYDIGDVVIQSNKIYQCNTAHTSSVFSSDLSNWTQLANNVSDSTGVLPMANGGTDKNLTPVLGGVVYTDDGSMEVLGAGTSGQYLKSNGAAAPSWTTLSIDDSSFSGVLSLGKGGTNKNLTAENGAILYLDADSVEKLSPGTSGQVLQSNGAGAPSFVNKSISAKSENGSSVTLEEIQVSNNLLTQTDTNKHLIESGNNNILVNPSFEHSTFSTGWTNTNGVFAEDTIVELHGKKAAKVTLTAQALSLHQDSTLYQSQFADGVQGLASVRVKTSVSGIKVCSKQAGIITSNLCVDVQANNKWGLYKVPFILGGTSNGISINSNSTNVTGDVYVDDAFVGANDLTQDMNACNDVSCQTEFYASVTSTGIVSGENLDWIDGNCVNSGTTNRRSTCTLKSNLALTQGMTCLASGAGSVVGVFDARVSLIASSTTTTIIVDSAQASDGAGSSSNYNITCQKQGADFTAAKQLSNGNTYSSKNADTDWTLATAPTIFGATTNPTLGTVELNALRWKRSGGDLEMRWQFRQTTAGTAGSGLYYIELPNGLQVDTSRMSNSNVSGFLAPVGYGSFSTSSGFFVTAQLQNGTTNRIYFVIGNELTSPSAWGSTVAGLGNSPLNISINIKVPIQGWQNSNIIIGQFNGLESCTNTLECTDTFSAKVSAAGVVSDENVDWLNGNCSVATTSAYSCSFNSSIFTLTPNCQLTPQISSASAFIGQIEASSSSSITARLKTDSAGNIASAFVLTCQKQGVDYIGKTAKSVASDQNLRTPGITKAVFYSAGLTSAGVPNIEIGDFLNGSCTCSSGSFSCSFNPGVWASAPSCQITNANSRDRNILYPTESTSSLSFSILTQAGTGVCEAVKISCHGVSP